MTTPFPYAVDIEEQILAALDQLFLVNLQTNVPTSDPLYLRTLRVNPLQDDPTQVAPYLTYGPDFSVGTTPILVGEHEREYGSIEIGGPVRFLYHYTATCGTPFVTTRETCLAQISNLSSRVVQLLMLHYDLSDILAPGTLLSADETRRIEGGNPLLIDRVRNRLEGGEQTWFGEAIIEWHYPVTWYLW